MPKALYLRSACLAAMIVLGPAPVALTQAGGGEVVAEGRAVPPRLSGDVFIPPVLTIPQGWREQAVSDGHRARRVEYDHCLSGYCFPAGGDRTSWSADRHFSRSEPHAEVPS